MEFRPGYLEGLAATHDSLANVIFLGGFMHQGSTVYPTELEATVGVTMAL